MYKLRAYALYGLNEYLNLRESMQYFEKIFVYLACIKQKHKEASSLIQYTREVLGFFLNLIPIFFCIYSYFIFLISNRSQYLSLYQYWYYHHCGYPYYFIVTIVTITFMITFNIIITFITIIITATVMIIIMITIP